MVLFIRKIVCMAILIFSMENLNAKEGSHYNGFDPNLGDIFENLNQQRKDDLDRQFIPQKSQTPFKNLPKNPTLLEQNFSSSPCFFIKHISLQSDISLLQDKIDKEFSFLNPIIRSYTNTCMDTHKIIELLNKLKTKAFKKGYITTDFGLFPQDLSTQNLLIHIHTSVLGKIDYEDKTKVLFWGKDYGINCGDIFRIAPIDRGLYNSKRLRTLNPMIKISSNTPSKDSPQQTYLTLNHQKSLLPLYASLEANNAGSTSTGIYQTSLQLGVENIFSLLEAFRVYGVFTPNWGKNHNGYISIDLNIPFRRVLLSINGSYSSYAQELEFFERSFEYKGYGANMDISANILLYLDSLNRVSVNLGLGKRWAKNYLANIELLPQRRNLTNIYAGIEYFRYIHKGSIDINIGIKQGLKFLGAMDNFSDSSKEPNFFYTIPTIDMYAYVPLDIKNQHFTYTSLLKTQVSRTRLYASEKFGLGGIYSVRGFDSLVLNGEAGILNRNDWAYYLPSFFGFLAVPTIGFDMGYTTDLDRSSQDGNKGFIIGGGAGIKLYWKKYFNAQIWGYKPLYNPRSLEERNFYASIAFTWG